MFTRHKRNTKTERAMVKIAFSVHAGDFDFETFGLGNERTGVIFVQKFLEFVYTWRFIA